MRATRLTLLSAVALAALVQLPVAAQAQDAAAAEEGSEDDSIIVTARRQNERLVDVPASVSVITAETLANTGVNAAAGFAQLTPGVTIVTGTAEAGDTQINIRGINGARDAESSVALVVDGILKTNTAQLNQVQGTLRQIEILKGPQGAIYGRNAAAGAIVISTLRPTDVLSGEVTGRYANENSFEGTGYISGPIGENAGFVLSGFYSTTDGFFRNLFLNRKVVDDQRTWAIDGRIMADLSDATSIDIKARYADLSGASINFNSVFHVPAFAGVNPAFYEDVNEHDFRYYSNIRPTNEQTSFDASIKLEHDFGSVGLTAWALYSNVEQALTADGTSADFARYISAALPTGNAGVAQCFASTQALAGYPVNAPGSIGTSPVPFIFNPATGSTFGAYSPTTCDGTQYQTRNQEDFSGEVRLASNSDGPLQWQLGGYFLHINRDTGVSLGADLGRGIIPGLYNAPTSDNPTSLLLADAFTTNVYAIFGSADYELTDTVSAGIALRYDIEDRSTRSLVPTGLRDPFTGGPINPGQAFGALLPQSETYRQLQPKVTLSWEPAPNTNIYANWGIGFKSGGFNNQGSGAIIAANNAFVGSTVRITDQYDKEVSSAFEVGIKGSLFDNRITFDLAGYHTDIDDMQFFEFFVGSFGLLRVVSNIDQVRVQGVELNLTGRIVEGWRVFGSVNMTDSEIRENSSRPSTVGNKSPYTADYTINLGTDIEFPVSNSVDFNFRADYRITGPTWFHTVQDATSPTLFSGLLPISALALPAAVGNARYDVAQREAFGVLNLRAGISGDNWGLAVFAENLLNRKYLNEVIPAIEFGGSFASPGARRLIGVEGRFSF